MQINNILNCHKPKSFTGLRETGKVRYKHYEEMPEQSLRLYSMAKAYKDVKDSKKSKLLKAMPVITSTLIATSYALTQPGKLSAKVNSGVGFLALVNGFNFLSDKISDFAYKHLSKKTDENDKKAKYENSSKASTIGALGAMGALVGAGVAIAKNKTAILNSSSKVVKFIKGEAGKLVSEINNTKLAKTIEEKFNPFMARHAKGFRTARNLAPFGIIIGSAIAGGALKESLSNDLSKKAVQNFIKGKAAQKDAREHFDSIDAIEV